MANRLVAFIQDEKKWTEHYMAQARKQVTATRVSQLKEFVQPEIVQPKLISPIAKLLAQAESELKREQNERPVFTPIVARPEFDKSEKILDLQKILKSTLKMRMKYDLPKERRHVDVLKWEGKRKRNSERIPKERRHMDILNRKEKRDHLCISETF